MVEKEKGVEEAMDEEYINVIWPKLKQDVINVMESGTYPSKEVRLGWPFQQTEYFYNNCHGYGLDPSFEDDDVATDDGGKAKDMRPEDVDLEARSSGNLGANAVKDVSNRSAGSSSFTSGMVDSRDCLSEIGVEDLVMSGLKFTWNKSPGKTDGLLKKLDRVMCNFFFVDIFFNANALFLPFVASNHTPAVVEIPVIASAMPRPFKFVNFLADKAEFLPIVKDVWDRHIPGHAMFSVVSKLKLLKKPLRKLKNAQDMIRLDYAPNSLTHIVPYVCNRPINRSIWSILQRLVIGALIYFVWQERNLRRFQHKNRPVKELYGIIRENVRLRLLSLKIRNSKQAKDASSDDIYFHFEAAYFGPWHLLVIHVRCEPSSDDTRINLYFDVSCLTDCPTWCVPSTDGVWLIMLICWHLFHGFFWSDMEVWRWLFYLSSTSMLIVWFKSYDGIYFGFGLKRNRVCKADCLIVSVRNTSVWFGVVGLEGCCGVRGVFLCYTGPEACNGEGLLWMSLGMDDGVGLFFCASTNIFKSGLRVLLVVIGFISFIHSIKDYGFLRWWCHVMKPLISLKSYMSYIFEALKANILILVGVLKDSCTLFSLPGVCPDGFYSGRFLRRQYHLVKCSMCYFIEMVPVLKMKFISLALEMKFMGDYFPFVYCVEKLSYEGKYTEWETCFEKLNLDPKPVKNCSSSGFGHEDYRYFISIICKAYKGSNVPQACLELSHPMTTPKNTANHLNNVCYKEDNTN
ncbi:Gamma interferon inducible lysosomal thiol reductase GILT [Artemisia annua]|uniref:Gamma interferon inducible lysosomal thiol reductase GILT n=1 Tax=Artemisia annua TaxID=35608 RepID=A0A2U1M9T9_ARTAN|nr:Gamma interferon inducible lysosomal thiol reductase GILT [Artemisia annua]